jgi:murein DD-endopeptidase MepM/ murein hydrolase activator NlpD
MLLILLLSLFSSILATSDTNNSIQKNDDKQGIYSKIKSYTEKVSSKLIASKPVEYIKKMTEYNNRTEILNKGIKITFINGNPIHAVLHGVVIVSDYIEGLGNRVIIEHENNVQTVYKSSGSNIVKVGDEIDEGQIIGFLESNNESDEAFLYLEYLIDFEPVEPDHLLMETE